jgi:hypothetical protein
MIENSGGKIADRVVALIAILYLRSFILDDLVCVGSPE